MPLIQYLQTHFDPSPVDTVEILGIQPENLFPLGLALTVQVSLQDQLSTIAYTENAHPVAQSPLGTICMP